MIDRVGEALFSDCDAAAVLHGRLAHELQVDGRSATLRLDLPLAEKGAISLKKIGLELVVRVDGHKRTIMLPPGLARFRPTGAAFEDGALEVGFVDGRVAT